MMFSLRRPCQALLLMPVFSACATMPPGTAGLTVPCGFRALIDGRIAAGEWDDASRSQIDGGAELLAKAAGEELHLAVRLPTQDRRYVDVYIQNANGSLLNLHASMQQGERLLTEGWSDSEPAFAWKPPGWESSVALRTGAGRDSPISVQLAPIEAYEMRVPTAHLGPAPHRLRVEVRDFAGEQPDWIYPTGSSRRDQSNWALIRRLPRCR